MGKNQRVILVLFSFVVLVALRPLGETFLYDPLELYFQHDYLSKPFPEMNFSVLWLSVSLKYFLNSLVSIWIIYLSFQNKTYTKFAIQIYALAYFVFICVFFGVLFWEPENSVRLLFYVRRFLMHPLLILILLPAFYYQELKMKNSD